MPRGPKPKRRQAAGKADKSIRAPGCLPVAERNIFRWVLRVLGDRVQPEDVHVVEQYSRALIRYRALCQLEQEHGKTDYKVLSLISQARSELEASSARLGMSPKDRAKLKTAIPAPPEEPSVLEQLLLERDN